MRDAVTQLAAFVDRARSLRSAVAANPAGERKFLEELVHPFNVFAFARVYLRISAFQIDRAQHARSAMTGASEENGVEIVFPDEAIEMNVGEAQTRARSPM